MLILLNNLPFNGTAMMYVEIPKCKLRMIRKLFTFSFSMKDLATKGREQIVL